MKSPLERLVEIQQAQQRVEVLETSTDQTIPNNLTIKDSSLTVNLNINLDSDLAQRLAAGAAMLGTALFFKASTSDKIKIPMIPKVKLKRLK